MKNDPFKKPRTWCFSTYFAEGLPYAIVRLMSSVFFTDIGMKERYIGYLNFLGIPWNLKFLWAPLLDIFGKKRTWMICIQALLSLFIACIACIDALIPAHGDTAVYGALSAAVFVVLAFVAATNDIAIDGYYMEGLRDPREQALYTGYRVFAYRLGLILVRSGFVKRGESVVLVLTGHCLKDPEYTMDFHRDAAAGDQSLRKPPVLLDADPAAVIGLLNRMEM